MKLFNSMTMKKEEFVPVEDDDLMEKLIEIVQTRFGEDDEDDE